MVGIGVRMHERGHRVTVIANDLFAPLVGRVGLEFASLGTVAEFRKYMTHPDIWHWSKGWPATIAESTTPAIRPVYRAIFERYVPGETVVAASTMAVGARVARDTMSVPLASVHISPASLWSTDKPCKLHGLFFPWQPAVMVRLQYWLADRLVISRTLAPPVNAFRAELGLPPVKRFFDGWLQSPDCVIGLFPPWYVPPAKDWPPQVRLTGFPMYDERGATEPPPELDAFLNEGPAPIAFTPGSGMTQGQSFFRAAVEACQRLQRRGILLTRYPEQLPAELPASIRHFDYAPFSWLLPRLCALVHHGGAGTTSQALAAGIPQLIMPMCYDQPDHAQRVQRLGVGDVLPPWRFSGPAVARKLKALLDSPTVLHQCREVAAKFEGHDPVGEICQILEGLQ